MELGRGQFSKPWEELEIKDNFLFCKIMSEPALCREMIRRILGIKVDELFFSKPELQFTGTYGSHSIRLDVAASDGEHFFDIEFQSVKKSDLPRRMRYYQGIMDMDYLTRSTDYENLNETYIVFICDFDPFGYEAPVYDIKMMFDTDSAHDYSDGTHKMYINLDACDKIEDVHLHAFLKYLETSSPQDGFTSEINDSVEFNRRNAQWRKEYMTVAFEIEYEKKIAREAGLAEGREVGLAEGREAGLAEGREAGLELGRAEGAELKSVEAALMLVEKYGVQPEQAALDMKLSEAARVRFFAEADRLIG